MVTADNKPMLSAARGQLLVKSIYSEVFANGTEMVTEQDADEKSLDSQGSCEVILKPSVFSQIIRFEVKTAFW